MEPRTLGWMADACGGTCVEPRDVVVRSVNTDSRSVQPGDLFFALRGERFDGHDFLPEVVRHRPAGVVIRREHPWPAGTATTPAGCGVIRVDDPRRALGRLAGRYRRDFQVPMVAVAGSNGKTSTKELLAAVLGRRFHVVASPASYNNDVGVPLTLLRLEQRHQAAVLEAGTNHPGELAPLLDFIQPTVGVLTGIGREHLEYFGDLEGVIREEGALAEVLGPGDLLVLNGDAPGAREICGRCRAATVKVGLQHGNDWVASKVAVTGSGQVFEVHAPDPAWSGRYALRLLGRPQVTNALLALAVGAHLGLDRETLAAGLVDCAGAPMRLELVAGRHGVQFLNDAYNANADSTRVALETLVELPGPRRRIAVIGDMAELGPHAAAAHAEAGEQAARGGVDCLIAVGAQADTTAAAARDHGLPRVHSLPDLAAARELLRQELRAGDLVLLKGSRTARLERLLTDWGAAAAPAAG